MYYDLRTAFCCQRKNFGKRFCEMDFEESEKDDKKFLEICLEINFSKKKEAKNETQTPEKNQGFLKLKKCAQMELNHRPPLYKSGALTPELCARN